MNDLTIPVDLDGPRVIYDLDFDEYRAIDAINASGLKLLERSPAHFQQARLEPHAPTAAQALGLSRRTVANYGDGRHAVPKTVLLAIRYLDRASGPTKTRRSGRAQTAYAA